MRIQSHAGDSQKLRQNHRRVLYFTAPKPLDFGSDILVMAVEKVAPLSVTDVGGSVGGVHDVSEQHRGEHSLCVCAASDARDELFDLVEHRSDVTDRPW
jgi:hypothetical protein